MSNLYRLTNSYTQHSSKKIKVQPIGLSMEREQEESVNSQESELEQKLIEAEETFKQAEKTKETAQQEAEQMLKDAKAQIEQEREWFEEEKKEALQKAAEEGYAQGFQKGEAEAKLEYQQHIKEAESIVMQTNEDYQRKIASADEDILQIALKATDKIIHQRFSEQPELFVDLIKKAIEEVAEQPKLSIYIHPSQYSIVNEHRNKIEQLLNEQAELSVYPKDHLSINDCIIESPYGRIDTSIDTQLNQLQNDLISLVEEND
ncbi:flagellar assembly protein FliH [Alkalibacillus aidingensis]|uniref:flagellar assembly protein FliH n=1 Tax=Alkalibacillus aidingensis TaxID=2747607 RepID=UPI001660707C|nr:flagellar assembly protein FliH [Alkalibacillus aidingensis]